MSGVVYYEAQTGIIRSAPPAVSNFYQYCIDAVHLEKLREIAARVEPSTADLKWLAEHDSPAMGGKWIHI
jgi:hypothetical protein